MAFCYYCEIEITPKNRSLEHIINDSIGGWLKSYDLLCKDCNSSFGYGFDASIAKAFSIFVNHLKIERDRGEVQDVVGKLQSTGKEIIVGANGKLKFRRAYVEEIKKEGKLQYSITAPNPREAKKAVRGLQRKHSLSDEWAERVLKDIKWTDNPVDDYVQFGIEIGGNNLLKAISKIAINFFIFSSGERKHVHKLLDVLKGAGPCDSVWFLNSNDKLFTYKKNQVCHSLYLHGNPDEGILYCVVDLFSTSQYVVILNENYTGELIKATYSYDLIDQEEVLLNCPFHLSKDFIVKYVEEGPDDMNNFQPRMERFLRISSQEQYLKKKIDNLVTEFYQKYKDIDFTNNPELFSSYFSHFMAHAFMPEIKAASEARRKKAEEDFLAENLGVSLPFFGEKFDA